MSEHSHDPTLIPPTVTFLGPPKRDDELGRLGQYRILKQLGRGGMGVVYQAQDTELNRLAALKVMHPDYAASEEARSRFKREAQAAAALKHEHIVTIYQVDVENNVPFLAMEFLAGKSLDEWLRPDRRATVGETLLIGKQIAKGLAAAHAKGLIHRDIKPANLWLEAPRGRVKILDFGLARRVSGDMAGLTQDGSILGTPAFMAPEQARGDAVDHRCDLFSLGCVLYRMLTGRLPFQGSTTYAVLTAIASETPTPVAELRPEVPQRLSLLVERLLAKKPEDRPPSAQAVFDELIAIEKESKQPPAPPLLLTAAPPRRFLEAGTLRLIAGIAGSVALLALAVVAISAALGEKKETAAAASRRAKDAFEAPRRPSPDKGAPEVQPAASPIETPTSIDLLEKVDLLRDPIMGRWSIPGEGQLLGRPAGESCLLTLPWDPPAEYRLRFRIKRVEAKPGFVAIGLAHGPSRMVVVLDAKLKKNSYRSGMGVVDGRPLTERSDGYRGIVTVPNLWVDIVITMREGEVKAELSDGTVLFEWTGDFRRLSRPEKMPQAPLLIGGQAGAEYAFENVVLEPLGNDLGRPLYDR